MDDAVLVAGDRFHRPTAPSAVLPIPSGDWATAKRSLRSPDCCVVAVEGMGEHILALQQYFCGHDAPADLDLRMKVRCKDVDVAIEDCARIYGAVTEPPPLAKDVFDLDNDRGGHNYERNNNSCISALEELARGVASLADGPLEGLCTDVHVRIVCASDYRAHDPMWHTDKCPLRGYVTLAGPGTQYLDCTMSPWEYAAIRTFGAEALGREKASRLQLAEERKFIVMKGDFYDAPVPEDAARDRMGVAWSRSSSCVHRSPPASAAQSGKRVILSLDLADGKDDQEWYEVQRKRGWRSGMTQRKSRLNMSAPEDQLTVGDLPFVSAHEFVDPAGGNSWENRWHYYLGLEHVQLCLADESEEGDVHLNWAYRRGGGETSHYGKSYHERILLHWEAGLECVADFLTDNASVATLDLSQNKIDDADAAKFLALAIWNHPALLFVDLSQCELGKTEGVLSEVMGGAGNLETLLLDHNDISTTGMALVAEFIATNTAMTTLSLAYNYVSKYHCPREEREQLQAAFADNAVAVGEALKKNTSIRQLSLGGLHGLEVPSFIDSKRATELLTHLDLNGNSIGKEGAEMIADYLERNPALVELVLHWNSLNSRAAKLIANALKSNDTLRYLDLDGNNLTDKSVPFLADMLQHNSTLLTLKLEYTDIQIKSGGRKELMKKAFCDTSSLSAIAESNHTCEVVLSTRCFGDTYELEMRKINALEDEAQKIRYKVVLALFAFDDDLFSPRSFDNVPLELMPRLLHLVQQEIGYGGFGKGIVEKTKKRRKGGFNPTLRRVHEVVSGWNQLPLLFVRGPGKPRKKRKRHVMSYKDDEDEDWTPGSR
ncbi:hypothetical protein ACHAXT_010846 [Thalassiosira profunda]